MNLARTPLAALQLMSRLGHSLRRMLPKQTSEAFGAQPACGRPSIAKIYVINLDRQPDRWFRIKKELRRIRDGRGNDLLSLTERQVAVDARHFDQDFVKDEDVDPYYTLADQLFVEPQPRTLPAKFELEAPIRMSRAEVAVAKSHINVWKRIAQGSEGYALILEDDVWFHPRLARRLDLAWKEIVSRSENDEPDDVIYISYKEAMHGAPKSFISKHVFRPVRGLWYLSGYILSKQGAEKLTNLLPCRGPIDLWMNHQFNALNVLATRRSIVEQITDGSSSNSYSILPTLSMIGAINSEGAALFNLRPTQLPVFAFGPANSGLSSLAMALSMLGYRCCSDLNELPFRETERLREGSVDRVFNAYVNVGCLEEICDELRLSYPNAKFIITAQLGDVSNLAISKLRAKLEGADVIVFDPCSISAWRTLCEYLKCAPPLCPFPSVDDLGQRLTDQVGRAPASAQKSSMPKQDQSPWIVERERRDWRGIQIMPPAPKDRMRWVDASSELDPLRWSVRSDTFPGNLALFRTRNVEFNGIDGATVHIRQENLGVRNYSAGAINSNDEYLYGRFESIFQACGVPGVVTGFFLHRNSPHQEIDIEIAGSAPGRLLTNVFYNPGDVGAPFDYGYRGSPSYIELGFDASKSMHKYVIEWTASEIRWLVDDKLIHRRVIWDPTPIPHQPMKLHFNTWPSRSTQLAGRLDTRLLPTMTHVRSIRASVYDLTALQDEATMPPSSDRPALSGASL